MSDAAKRIAPSCVEALENYHQADMDGIMVLASRQAIHETIDAYWARVKTCEELEAKLAKAVDALVLMDKAAGAVAMMGAVKGPQWTRLTVALLKGRAALAEIKGDSHD